MSIALDIVLSPEEIECFVTQGYLHLKGVIPRDVALEAVERQFASVGWNAFDHDTWTDYKGDRRVFRGTRSWPAQELAPRYWAAANAMLGGVERLNNPNWTIDDGMAANLCQDVGKPWIMPGDRAAWHKDGYFFRHFLDSPEQALLGLVCWSDVVSHGGATCFAPESVGAVARYLADHPEGVHPNGFPYAEIMAQCPNRLEAVGEAGDVFLMHSYMLHTVAPNPDRHLRCISNMVVALKEPMDFNRANPADFSPLERTVLHALGVERYDFKPTRPRLKTPDWGPLPMSEK